MTTPKRELIVIPANPELVKKNTIKRQLRVAAYCRVSTDDEEQLTSYEAQQNYYTDKIMTNPNWTMAGIFADEGITGTSANKRPEFLRMIRKCRQKKIDLVLVKSISRFARNTVDCLNYIRVLKELGIAVIFEKENINTLESESEMMITMMGAFAQAESESMSANIRWGKRQAMREGKVIINYSGLYGYRKGEDGNPQIVPEEAEAIRLIYDRFLAGASLRMIETELKTIGAPLSRCGKPMSMTAIRNILTNEKYCGDVLMQKTFIEDCISKKSVRNIGQLPKYLVKNHHEGIISRETFNAAQAELARRSSGKAPSLKQAPTGRACYSPKYALTGIMFCGDCGTLYQRCVWRKQGQLRPVWRCASRIDYGARYCKESPTIYEKGLHAAILGAINSMMSDKDKLIAQISDAVQTELVNIPGETMSIADIDRRIEELNQNFQALFEQASRDGSFNELTEELAAVTNETAALREKRAFIIEQQQKETIAQQRKQGAEKLLEQENSALTEWDESMIRQVIESVKVLAADRVLICFKSGAEVEANIDPGLR